MESFGNAQTSPQCSPFSTTPFLWFYIVWTLSKHPRINRRLTQIVLRGHKTMHSKKSAPIETKYRLIRFKILILFPHNASGWYKNISPRSWINKKETCLPLQRASFQPAVEGGGARQPSQKPGCPHITWFPNHARLLLEFPSEKGAVPGKPIILML